MKKCKTCGLMMPIGEFYVLKHMADGHLNECKECVKRRVRKHRKKNIDRIREYDRQRGMLPHRVKARKEYAKTTAGKKAHMRAARKQIKLYPEKRAARILTGNAIKNGRLIKKPCEVCGNKKVHAHHDDYCKPLDVRWLCTRHHREWHKTNEPKS